ncbi:MAG: hypothetical protein N2662_07950 [Bacteroidales bacterium]|nr:hypothetical protein [Bacteroidales bacterium]
MMFKISPIIFFLVLLVLLNNCGDKEYDWKKVEPGNLKIMPIDEDTAELKIDTLIGNNYTIKSYKVIPRGGSTYQWTSSSEKLIITPRPNMPYIVDVKANSNFDTETWLTVNETTWGGKNAKPDSVKIIIIGYCPFNPSQLIANGKFVSKMTSYAPYSVSLSMKDNDTLINHNFFNMRWPVKYLVDPGYEQKISIVPNQLFEYNGDYVTVKGQGTYNTCKNLIVVKFAVCYLYGDTLDYGSGIDSLRLQQ